MIGSRKITPPRMLRIVPFGLFHISLRRNSLTRASSGVMVAHLTPTPHALIASAASMVIWSLVSSRCSIEIFELDVEIGKDELVANHVPDDARHLVAVEFDDGILDLDLGHWMIRSFGPRRRGAAIASVH